MTDSGGAGARIKGKVIITCAVTGAIHTPSMSPYLPVTPDEIADAAIAAAEAGAAILHLHARDPVNGRPTQDPAVFEKFLPRIKSSTDAAINITTGGSPHMTVEERMRPAATFKPEVASLNMGSMNFGLFRMLERFQEFTHDWERQHLENSRDLVFKNTYKDVETILRIGNANGTRFEFECYDISHLYNLAYFVEAGLAKPPLFIQSVFGLLGGIGGHPEDLMHMRRTADRLFGDRYRWSILGAGRNQIPLATIGAAMGANVRVGLEDSLWIGPGKLAESNAAQVRKIRQVLDGPVARGGDACGWRAPCSVSRARTRSRSDRGVPAVTASGSGAMRLRRGGVVGLGAASGAALLHGRGGAAHEETRLDLDVGHRLRFALRGGGHLPHQKTGGGLGHLHHGQRDCGDARAPERVPGGIPESHQRDVARRLEAGPDATTSRRPCHGDRAHHPARLRPLAQMQQIAHRGAPEVRHRGSEPKQRRVELDAHLFVGPHESRVALGAGAFVHVHADERNTCVRAAADAGWR